MVNLSEEQQLFIDKALEGYNILVDACIGSGKTTSIQELCNRLPLSKRILYLTYNKLLKLDAKEKIKNGNTFVQNYHGFAYCVLQRNNIQVGQSDLIQTFLKKKPAIPKYDVLIIDEYQDIEQELAELLDYIKSYNPKIQIIAVGDMQQKIYDKTTLNVPKFIHEFMNGHYESINFTKCFRLSEDHAAMLGRIWQKEITGVNTNCIVEKMNLNEVVSFLKDQEPKDILCLGSRNGNMARVLNRLEEKYPKKFNKNTVYASIMESDSIGKKINPRNTSAIFTTYDSSKGMERPICVVFDFTEDYWQTRLHIPRQSYDILRNIFCVAASRGKQRIIFASGSTSSLKEETLSKNEKPNENFRPMHISGMFDFKYKEDVEECFSLLEKKEIPQQGHTTINIKSSDGLIDLSPCIGEYQEFAFFKNYSIDEVLKEAFSLGQAEHLYTDELKKKSAEEKILALTAFETKQNRYSKQVTVPYVRSSEKNLLIKRLGEYFSPDEEQIQVPCEIAFAKEDMGLRTLTAVGKADAVLNDTVWELKFVSELSHEHFLQCAMYMIALGLEKGILWNVRDNKMFEIHIPDKKSLLDAVARTITKHAYEKYYEPVDNGIENKIFTMSNKKNLYSQVEEKAKDKIKSAEKKEAGQKKRLLSTVKDTSPYFAVIDTEVNMSGELMSIGIVIARKTDFRMIRQGYVMVTPACNKAAMFSASLKYRGEKLSGFAYCEGKCTIAQTISAVQEFLNTNRINTICAFNLSTERRLLPFLRNKHWCDIMDIALYKQYNKYIPKDANTFSTGRLKNNSGVRGIMRMLQQDNTYEETHNALQDAMDELEMMQLLGNPLEQYFVTESK